MRKNLNEENKKQYGDDEIRYIVDYFKETENEIQLRKLKFFSEAIEEYCQSRYTDRVTYS